MTTLMTRWRRRPATLVLAAVLAATGTAATVLAGPTTQAQAQDRTDREYADLYSRTVAAIRNAMGGEAVLHDHGAGRLIRDPDPRRAQQVNIGRLADDAAIGGGRVRGVFRRDNLYLVGLYVERPGAERDPVLYVFTEGQRDAEGRQVPNGRRVPMLDNTVLPGVRRAYLTWNVNYANLQALQINRRGLQDAVRTVVRHRPDTAADNGRGNNGTGNRNHALREHVERLAVALAEGARFQVIPGQIAQALRRHRGQAAWTVNHHADEITSWDALSGAVVQARNAAPDGRGPAWNQTQARDWNGRRIQLSALDLSHRLAIIKPDRRPR
ncbi:ribosome-inactivating family protein [Streptomyces mashuensis]|uniref:ribosome-inactivating family protein n=1 Tax=Streptomyces mashuensis TaxID=33904 RepID=UPI00167D4B6B|nr:ribosome-inactivating family protein [Streptomyces mashuensis]